MALILFDFDGVLADTLGDLIRFGQEVCDELGVERTVSATDLDVLETMSFADYGRQLGVPETLNDEFVRRCLKRFAEKESPPRIFPDLGRVVRELAGVHALAVVTSNSVRNVDAFLVEHGLRDCIQVIFGVDTPGTKSEKIRRAQAELAKNGEPVFMVGDSISDIRAAREAGVKCVAVGWGHQSARRLAASKPDHLVHTPAELTGIIRQASPD
jgi:phosphoglycolate phosphatase